MPSVMLQFKHPESIPTIDDVRRIFDLAPDEIDAQFGVIPTDPANGLYTVLIDTRASQRVEAALTNRPRETAEGIFANPPIEPFDPPEPGV